MADTINSQNYETVITALTNFAASVEKSADELNSCCEAAASVLPHNDKHSEKIVDSAQKAAGNYKDIALRAKYIAAIMQSELDCADNTEWKS